MSFPSFTLPLVISFPYIYLLNAFYSFATSILPAHPHELRTAFLPTYIPYKNSNLCAITPKSKRNQYLKRQKSSPPVGSAGVFLHSASKCLLADLYRFTSCGLNQRIFQNLMHHVLDPVYREVMPEASSDFLETAVKRGKIPMLDPILPHFPILDTVTVCVSSVMVLSTVVAKACHRLQIKHGRFLTVTWAYSNSFSHVLTISLRSQGSAKLYCSNGRFG